MDQTIILWVMHFIPFCRLRVDEIPELIGNDQPWMGGHAYEHVGTDLEASLFDDADSATGGCHESCSPVCAKVKRQLTTKKDPSHPRSYGS